MQLKHILQLGIKELRSLTRDPLLMILITYAFTLSVYTAATAIPGTLHKAPIAIVNEDNSPLSWRIVDAFYPPYFLTPRLIDQREMDARMDAGLDTFALDIPPNFQRDLLAGRQPTLQLNVDATRMSQAFNGNGYVQQIVMQEVRGYLSGHPVHTEPAVALNIRTRFNPEMNQVWFASIMEMINHITMLSLVLTGAALIREREHGTLEHLLVMPITPLEIMCSKVWSMALVVLVASFVSLTVVIQGVLQVRIEGAVWLFLCGTALHLFATTSLGIYLATIARSMPQFALLLMLLLLPLQILSGATTPRESMPALVQHIMLIAPNTHFVMLAQSILYRGAGIGVVWPQFLALATIGCGLFYLAHARFRKAIVTMA